MKKITTQLFILFLLCAEIATAQNFEGKIIYHNDFKSKTPKLTDQQMNTMLGATEEYLVKGGNYKNTTNGTFMIWQLYINADNKLYNKMANSETIFYYDGETRDDSCISIKINKNAATILGYKCDELVMVTKKGTQHYFFAPQLAVDPNLYKKHNFGCWYDYLKAAKALPLKMVIEGGGFVATNVATDVKPMKIDDKEFRLSAGAKTAKSPY